MPHRFKVLGSLILCMMVLLATPPGAGLAAGTFCNALERNDLTAYGASAYITWTNPNLNGGAGSYHRVATAQLSPWRYAEFGWEKGATNGFRGKIVVNDGTGNLNTPISGITQATHRYSMQYDPNNGKYWFYVDGANVWNQNANFSAGNRVLGGGEAYLCVEGFGNTNLYDLRYVRRNADGTFTSVAWNGHQDAGDNAPYYNTNGGLNSFYDNP